MAWGVRASQKRRLSDSSGTREIQLVFDKAAMWRSAVVCGERDPMRADAIRPDTGRELRREVRDEERGREEPDGRE